MAEFKLVDGIVFKGTLIGTAIAYKTTSKNKTDYLTHLDNLITSHEGSGDTIRSAIYEDWETTVTAL